SNTFPNRAEDFRHTPPRYDHRAKLPGNVDVWPVVLLTDSSTSFMGYPAQLRSVEVPESGISHCYSDSGLYCCGLLLRLPDHADRFDGSSQFLTESAATSALAGRTAAYVRDGWKKL